MKYLSILLLLLLACLATSPASQLGIFIVKMPIYLHGSDSDAEIRIMDVPFASAGSTPESTFSAISEPFTPPSDKTWNSPANVNLASIYGIKVSAEEDGEKDVTEWNITVNASAAKAPEGYPFTVAQVTDAVLTCVKSMCPMRPLDELKVTVKVVPAKATTK